MRIGICSFSFHRLLAAGKQDVFQYIRDCKELGCTQLDPWNAHLAPLKDGDAVLHAGHHPDDARLAPAEDDYIDRVKAAADEVGLPFGCIAADGAHVYEEDEEAREANRRRARRWLEIARRLGAEQVRIDAGGPEDLPEHSLRVIVDGYRGLIETAADAGIQIVVENHWGPTRHPANVLRLLEEVEGLGYLFDTHNWARGEQQEGWERCAEHADAVHIKTFAFDDDGNESSVDLSVPIGLLVESGYSGCWSVESVPQDGDEYGAARKTIELVRREVTARGGG
jgi:sugar phosphate isomerase/epimerase